MSFRIELVVINEHPKGSRFGLTVHNLSDESYGNWCLNFLFDRHIVKNSLSQGEIEQTGSFCQLRMPHCALRSNNHVYVEFEITTLPFRFYCDGIKDAFIAVENNGEVSQLNTVITPIVLASPYEKRSIVPDVEVTHSSLIPQPLKVEWHQGCCLLTSEQPILAEVHAAQEAANWLLEEMSNIYGLVKTSAVNANIVFRHSPVLNNEEYKLDVTPENIKIEASSQTGFIYACATLLQLLKQPNGCQYFEVPCVKIHDKPRFAYRGMMLDSARSFQPKQQIKRLLNQLAHYKINTFHWHLTDDEGWRVEIKALPQLTEIGAWRGLKQPLLPQFHHLNEHYGGFYSQDDIREIVDYATQRGINIIPEIDIPGHCRAAIVSLPYLLVDPDDDSQYRSIQGYHDNVLSPALEGTYVFLDAVLEEVAQLFPGPYVHIGADEVPNGVWEKSARCQEMMKQHQYSDSKELQGHLLRYAEDKLKSLGKRMLGWEEAQHGNKVSKDTVIYSWVSEEAALSCAKLGYDVVLQPGQSTYLDMTQDYAPEEPGVDWASVIPLEAAYLYEPLSELAKDDPLHKRVWGIQSALWTEIISSPERLDYMVYPRLIAIAETAWSAPQHKDWSDFLSRLKTHLPQLDTQNIHYRSPWKKAR
ncbi:family 20 glycosylhydrolase [Vibrio sp. ZSDZ34]|uniref:beta-N-acetylhexosaminidase n=1 Tax=Vibrio gelatinilyticus TaxID=2893468 RepID=A0A9X1WDP3_9VIBR|nr:family 20 glycosylhydrolase [Vibrio gelatinilyticus]MCJ2378693.1 family 20 glycosylhydrolase [Vibrio gelatinilyticus]